MKIGIINNLFFPYDRGGAERIVANQISALQKDGHDVFLITTKPIGASPLENGLNFPIYRLESQYFSLGGWPIFLRPIWQLANLLSWRKYRAIKNLLITQKPDLIITHNLMGLGFLTPLAIKQLSIEHEHWLHDIQLLHPSGLIMLGKEKDIDSLLAKSYQCLTRLFFASPSRIVSPSQWLMQEHNKRNFFSSSKKIITTIISPPEQSGQLAPAGPEKTFLFVGQIEAHKGILALINAFKKSLGSDRRLVIIGDGQKLEAARRLAVGDHRIFFRGRLSHADTKKAMTEASWLVVPSLCYENFPTVISEAQAIGLPIIASALGGIPEMLSVKDISYNPKNEDELIKHLSD